ncbi:MAG: GGDEF domain-containing phosphodiesterase, partial [Pseudomonadota bacterium]
MDHKFELSTAKATQDAEGSFSILAIGIDNLAALEELFGEGIGDDIASEVEGRLRRFVPHIAEIRETAYRRFLIGLPGFSEAAVEELFNLLKSAVASEAVSTGYGPMAISVSAGCAMASPGGLLPRSHEMNTAALHALHMAAASGAGAYHVARDDGALLAWRQMLMETSRAAFGHGTAENLTLAYQPVVRAIGGNAISFHECLVRIRRPDGGLLPAAAFMPAIEQLGLAMLIDRQVLLMAMETLVRHPTARLSVNIFPQTMQDRQWISLFEGAAANDPTLPERLILEVTETVAMLDPARTQGFMDQIRRLGTGFAIDDFGSGHTSLAKLRDFRFDILKIDGSFVRDVDSNPDNQFIMETLSSIAERFDMMT